MSTKHHCIVHSAYTHHTPHTQTFTCVYALVACPTFISINASHSSSVLCCLSLSLSLSLSPSLCLSPSLLQEFNLALLAPCLSVGVQRLTQGQGAVLLDTALQITMERLSATTALLPTPHHSFLPPSDAEAEPKDYWEKLADVYSEL